MYPRRELIRLGTRKAALRRRIGRQREACVSAATRVLRPAIRLDGLLRLWRGLSPLVRHAASPAGLWLKRSASPRFRLLGALLRWGPLVLGAVRALAAGRRP